MLKQFMGPFIMAFLIVVFTLLMQFLWKYIDDLIGKGLALSVIGELLLYTSAQLSIMAFPLAVLLASIFTMGNLGENYELIALKAAGISLQRIILPLIVLSCVIAGGAFVFANNVTPVTNLKMRTLIYDIQQQRPELQIREGIFYNGIEGYSIRIGRRNYKNNQLYDLRIYDHTKKVGNTSVILADSGHMAVTTDKRFLEIILYHGHSYVDMVDRSTINKPLKTYPFRHDFFDKQIFRMTLPGFDLIRSDEQIFKQSYQMMNLNQLKYTIDSLDVVIGTQEDQLRKMVQPTYRTPELAQMSVDTSLRTKVPDNFMANFDKETKAKKQMAIREAINQARAQKDQFAGVIYELDDKNKRSWKYEIEWHRKFTMSLACIIFFFIGAPLGAIIRKGGIGTPVIIAVIFFVLYYVVSMIGEKSAREGAMTPFEGMWMSTFIVLPIGVFLTYQATRDSSIFDRDLYLSYIKKGLNFIFVTHRSPRHDILYEADRTDLMPESMIDKLDELSHQCNLYLDENLGKIMRFSKIWYKNEDTKLTEIGNRYDNLKAILQQSDIDMIKETVEEYPRASLRNYKIKKTAGWQPIAAAIIFPVWIYLYLKAWIQKVGLRNELKSITGANRNLINELNSII